MAEGAGSQVPPGGIFHRGRAAAECRSLNVPPGSGDSGCPRSSEGMARRTARLASSPVPGCRSAPAESRVASSSQGRPAPSGTSLRRVRSPHRLAHPTVRAGQEDGLAPGRSGSGLLALFSMYWDDSLHTDVGRDTFWSTPHVVLYAAITVTLGVFAWWGLRRLRAEGLRRILADPLLRWAAVSGGGLSPSRRPWMPRGTPRSGGTPSYGVRPISWLSLRRSCWRSPSCERWLTQGAVPVLSSAMGWCSPPLSLR